MAVIVAELSKSWPENADTLEPGKTLGVIFEDVIRVNAGRGYRLLDWHYSQIMTEPGKLSETIIAVFDKESVAESVIRLGSGKVRYETLEELVEAYRNGDLAGISNQLIIDNGHCFVVKDGKKVFEYKDGPESLSMDLLDLLGVPWERV